MSKVVIPLQQPYGIINGLSGAARGIAGPASYVTGGIVFAANYFGFGYSFRMAWATASVSATYSIRIIPVSAGDFKTFKMMWVVFSTGAEVGSGVDLSAERVNVWAYGQ